VECCFHWGASFYLNLMRCYEVLPPVLYYHHMLKHKLGLWCFCLHLLHG
jgi:hypothetical protein